ncbi:MAG TPA: MATE family efflux transporter, partial [candidate division Zixibacteria bacterium]|nr:MATE family efflux transporter [candidate division Zixibacteria bacterium]
MLDLSRKNLNRTILTLAWPAVLENLLQTSVYIVDSIFIGRLGTQAFAAVGQSSMILFTVIFVFYGVGVATGAIVARNLGRNDVISAGKAAGQGMIL